MKKVNVVRSTCPHGNSGLWIMLAAGPNVTAHKSSTYFELLFFKRVRKTAKSDF
jgi:hypothetical protein